MNKRFFYLTGTMLFALLLLLTACGPIATINPIQKQPTVTVDKNFQQQVSPMPQVPQYRCGAWASNNGPNPYSSIAIYSRLVDNNVQGVAGATAQAVVHFKSSDVTLDQRPTSDSGGYVSFQFPLQGRQPALAAATVDISFSVHGKTVQCTPAFFTPQ